MRERGLSRHTISATPRQLESLIRLSEAIAKMQLKEEVTEEDVEEAIELMRVATLRSATDPVTGRIDFDIITTGRSQAAKQKVQIIAKKLSAMLTANESKYRKTTSLQQV
jgi:DNA replication licensing factor MCM4